MDLAINANDHEDLQDMVCDLMISPKIPKLKPSLFIQYEPFYDLGRKCAEENMNKIKELLQIKEHEGFKKP